jgi:hypothetical protein
MFFSLALRGLLAFAMLASGVAVAATDQELSQADRIDELERTVKVLAEELERTRADVTVPEEEVLVSRYGLGPAASKVYGISRGLSIGGYAEGFYQNVYNDPNGMRDNTDMLRAVLYTGYKFNEQLVFNMETEFEHGTTSSTRSSGGGSVSVEFATLDYFWREEANGRAGLLLIPMGFINQIHEPNAFFGVLRPEVERRLIPTTWRENGIGVFGGFGDLVHYEAYLTNGLNAEGYDATGIRDARQLGNRAIAQDVAFTARLDLTPLPGLLVGASTFLGNSGQDQSIPVTGFPNANLPNAFTAVWDVHAQYQWQGLHLRGLFTMVHVDDAAALTLALRPTAQGGINEIGATEVIANAMLGGYVEVAYDVLRWFLPDSEKTLEPFFRFEYLDTQFDVPSGFVANQAQENQVYTAGLQFKPIPNVVFKADFRNKVADAGSSPDEINLGIGLAF